MNSVEVPVWAKYAGDVFFLVLFLVFFFFFKPTAQAEDEWNKDGEDSEEEAPNPLEQILMTEGNEKESPSDREGIKNLPADEENRNSN